MTFKNVIEKDIKKTFINVQEFSTIHTFDRQPVNCIVDDDKLVEQTLKSVVGTYKGVKMIHIAQSDLKGRPKNGAKVEFDNKMYTITDCIDNDGILTITLDINKAL